MESGDYTLIFLKTRSSSSLNHRVKLAYDPECMRITSAPKVDPEKVRSYEEIREEVKAKPGKTEVKFADAIRARRNF
jgi:hypothetical protein